MKVWVNPNRKASGRRSPSCLPPIPIRDTRQRPVELYSAAPFTILYSMNYVCRDCGCVVNGGRPTNKCPQCGSLYLIPQDEPIQRRRRPKVIRISIEERFVSLVVGVVAGFLTFFIWGIVILVKSGPGAAKAAAGAFYLGARFGIKLSAFVAIAAGLVGFFGGEERLVRFLSILWGTDPEFNERMHQIHIPDWVVVVFGLIVLLGMYGYFAMHR